MASDLSHHNPFYTGLIGFWGNIQCSQVVEITEELFIVVQLFQIYIVGLLDDSMAVETVMVFSNFVGILARSWNFDWAWPIGVSVAQWIGEILKIVLWDVIRLIHTYEEMGGSDTTLCGLLWYQEEVKALVVVLVLHKLAVDDTTRLWVWGFSIAVLNEHSLVDPFVDHDKGDGWHWKLVVERLNCLLELGDFLGNDLVSHLLSHSVSVDDDFGRLHSLVVVCILPDGVHQTSIKVFFDNFLILFLDNDVGEVRGALSISWGRKTNNRLLSCMTHIDTNDHDSLLLHELREFDPDGLTTNFRVDLLHDIWGHW